MITRGYFVGEIIDDLIGISHQVDNRCMLGLTDINKYLEDFFKELLNKILGVNLVNLNQDHSNVPGLDLGDDVTKIAFQVTSQKTSAKINETLAKLSAEQLKTYDKIKVLVIGTKQKTYSLDEALCSKCNFSENDIWDIGDVCKKTMDLPLNVLQNLYSYIKAEVVRVKIDLEIPDLEGNYPTGITDYIEKIPTPKLGDCKQYYEFQIKKHKNFELNLEEVQADFKELSAKLSQLPRITREFYAFLLERRDPKATSAVMGGRQAYLFNYDRLKRICLYPDYDGELRLLSEARFVDFNEPSDVDESQYVRVFVPAKSDYFFYELLEYLENTKIGYKKPLVSLDFSDF